MDLDFLLLEYDRGTPSALIEYKSEFAGEMFPTHPSLIALSRLGNKAGLPVFIVRYAQDFSWWKVMPLNFVAKKIIPERIQVDEKTFVTFLYKELRGIEPPEEIFKVLETAI